MNTRRARLYKKGIPKAEQIPQTVITEILPNSREFIHAGTNYKIFREQVSVTAADNSGLLDVEAVEC